MHNRKWAVLIKTDIWFNAVEAGPQLEMVFHIPVYAIVRAVINVHKVLLPLLPVREVQITHKKLWVLLLRDYLTFKQVVKFPRPDFNLILKPVNRPKEMTEAEKENWKGRGRNIVKKYWNKWIKFRDYSRQISDKFEDNKEVTLNDFKTKLVRSESVKSIKQLNCAAYTSIKAAKLACQINNFNTPGGSLEQADKLQTLLLAYLQIAGNKNYNTDVTPEHPVGFQQSFYESVKFKSDSITQSVTSLKETHKEIGKKIEEKELWLKK